MCKAFKWERDVQGEGDNSEPITVHFSINDRNAGGRLGQQRGGFGKDAAARQSSDCDLDMEGADGEPESGPACLSGILTYPHKSSILIHTYPYLSIFQVILYDPIPSAKCLCSGFAPHSAPPAARPNRAPPRPTSDRNRMWGPLASLDPGRA